MKIELSDIGEYKLIAVRAPERTASLTFNEFRMLLDENREAIISRVQELVAQGHRKLIFDISASSYLHSGGVSIFIQAIKMLDKKGEIGIITSNATVISALEGTRLTRIVNIYPTLEEFRKRHDMP